MNKLTGSILIGFFAIIATGCTDIGPKTLTPESGFVTPTQSAITPTMTLSSLLETQQSDARESWIDSAHAEAENTVNCDACHQLQNGIAEKDIAWRNQITSQYESVADSNDLCAKCHSDADTAKTAHLNQSCVDCHDPHQLTASCLSCHKQIKQAIVIAPSTPTDGHPNDTPFCEGSGCHSVATQVAKLPFSIHDATHSMVTCAACHAADGVQVGPSQDGSVWSLWREVEVNGEKVLMPYQSHNLQFEVDCERCHFEGNLWKLRSFSNGELEN